MKLLFSIFCIHSVEISRNYCNFLPWKWHVKQFINHQLVRFIESFSHTHLNVTIENTKKTPSKIEFFSNFYVSLLCRFSKFSRFNWRQQEESLVMFTQSTMNFKSWHNVMSLSDAHLISKEHEWNKSLENQWIARHVEEILLWKIQYKISGVKNISSKEWNV